MFDSCLCQTYKLIQEQVQRARIGNVKIKFLFMVGGFSESPYMFTKIKSFVEKQNIEAIRPPYAWSTLVRGAATKCLEQGGNVVLKRKSRRHYGTVVSERFIKGYHDKRDMYIDDYNGKTMADNQMEWLIRKGQDLLTSEARHAAVEITCYWWFGEAKNMTWKLLSCYSETAPSRSVEKSVYCVAKLAVDFSDLPKRDMTIKTSSSGRQYYTISCMVNISLQSSLEFYVTVKGKKYGSLTVSYD